MQLNGLSVIRAFNKVSRFEARTQHVIDEQNVSCSKSRADTALHSHPPVLVWVAQCTGGLPACRAARGGCTSAARLTVQAVVLYGAVDRDSVDAARFAVTLTYILATSYSKSL
jgi:hypothetical protein